MTNDVCNRAEIKLVQNVVRANGGPERDPRLEVLNLRSQLNECRAEAARHAVMVREGDHRIKNSLQLIVSLLNLQARREPEGAIRDAVHTAAARVGSVAAIHDALQAGGGFGSIDLGATLEKACAKLQAMAGEEGRIQVLVDAEALKLPVAFAQPLVIAVNELVVNALRHAFTDDETGNVRVNLAATRAELALTVADDGKGLAEETVFARGYGMSLVDMMVQQINGTLTVRSDPGTTFTITARLPAPAPTH